MFGKDSTTLGDLGLKIMVNEMLAFNS